MEIVTVSEERLDRIEGKVDTLIQAMAQMVRLEERIATHQAGMERFGFRMDDMEERLEVIEKKMPLVNLILNAFGKVGILVLTAIVLGVLSLIFVV